MKDNGSSPDSPAHPPSHAGKVVIFVIFAIGIGAGLFASIYWSRPENAVAGSFTQIHASFLRGPKEKAKRLLAPKVVMDGRELSADEFLATYVLPPDAATIEVTPCASAPGHWVLAMKERRYCFYREGKTWKLHWLQKEACSCK